MKSRILFLSLFIIFAERSHATVYLEPSIGYAVGKYKSDFVQTSPTILSGSTDADAAGLTYGGKVGFTVTTLSFGVDYTGSQLSISGGANTSEDIGAFLRVGVLPFLDVSGSYFLSSRLTNSSASASGNGFKLGAGYAFLPMIRLNLDYAFDRYNSVNPSSPTTYSSSSATLTRWILSVSVPIDL